MPSIISQKGGGKIFAICGDAETGKSRLVEEFKATLDLEKIQWLEGRAYAYAQNIPYFPLIDLLNRVFQIEEGDSPDTVRQKLESGVTDLVEKKEILATKLKMSLFFMLEAMKKPAHSMKRTQPHS